jgi:phosphoribosylpyrophosphate synthetase
MWTTFPAGSIDRECADKSVVLVCTLDRPNDKILSLVFLVDAARARGQPCGLVAPYLASLRQDRQLRVGEAVTSRTCARLVSGYSRLSRHDRSDSQAVRTDAARARRR